MFPSIFKASIENFCCSLLLSLSASAIRSMNASSLSWALSRNDSTVGSSAAAALTFFLAAFFPSFRLFGAFLGAFFGVLFGVLVHFPFLPLFFKNKDFAKASGWSSSESEVYTSPDGPGRSSGSSDPTTFLFKFWAEAAAAISASKISLSRMSWSIPRVLCDLIGGNYSPTRVEDWWLLACREFRPCPENA